MSLPSVRDGATGRDALKRPWSREQEPFDDLLAAVIQNLLTCPSEAEGSHRPANLPTSSPPPEDG
jgi:hypothetical protein